MRMFPASHFPAPKKISPSTHRRTARGIAAHAGGLIAEARVTTAYEDRGAEILARRWRARSGEIDMIVRDGDMIIFVEVKKSASHEQAALRLSRRQMDRICQAALEFCETLPTGSLTDMRFDAALVDDLGAVEILENAFGAN